MEEKRLEQVDGHIWRWCPLIGGSPALLWRHWLFAGPNWLHNKPIKRCEGEIRAREFHERFYEFIVKKKGRRVQGLLSWLTLTRLQINFHFPLKDFVFFPKRNWKFCQLFSKHNRILYLIFFFCVKFIPSDVGVTKVCRIRNQRALVGSNLQSTSHCVA
jgi:hypothetical protein